MTKTSPAFLALSCVGFIASAPAFAADAPAGAGAEPQSSGAWQIDINLTPNLKNLEEAWKGRKAGGVKTSTKEIKTKPKSGKWQPAEAERDGTTSHGLFRVSGYLATLASGHVVGQRLLLHEENHQGPDLDRLV